MGKALVIKNSNFYSNRLDHVDFADRPCTGITLDKSQGTVTDTLTLIATPSPSNTTDSVVWSTSDARIATVSNGVVTAVSNGTAQITATCGNYSASCTVTVDVGISIAKGYLTKVEVNNENTAIADYASCSQSNMNFTTVGVNHGVYPVSWNYDTGDIAGIYPIPIPSGAKTINVGLSTDYASLIVYYDKDSASTEGSGHSIDSAKVLDGQTSSSGSQWSISAWTYGNQTFSIPATSGIDSFTLTIYAKTATAQTNLSVDKIGITFGYDD